MKSDRVVIEMLLNTDVVYFNSKRPTFQESAGFVYKEDEKTLFLPIPGNYRKDADSKNFLVRIGFKDAKYLVVKGEIEIATSPEDMDFVFNELLKDKRWNYESIKYSLYDKRNGKPRRHRYKLKIKELTLHENTDFMSINEIPDKRKFFVGVDCDDEKMRLGIVNTYGQLISSGSTFFPKDSDRLGEHIIETVIALRGGANVRMKNFAGIGISLRDSAYNKILVKEQINKEIIVPVYIDTDYDGVKQIGKKWIEVLQSKKVFSTGSVFYSNLEVIYGAVKLVKKEIREAK